MRQLLLLLSVIFTLSSFAQGSAPFVMTFKEWRDAQVLEAQNNVVRLSNKIQLLKTGRYKSEDPNKDKLVDSEKELRRALEGLQYAKDLTIDEYTSVYLSQFKNQSDLISGLTLRMSKEEMAEILKSMLQVSKETEASSSELHIRNLPVVSDGASNSREPIRNL